MERVHYHFICQGGVLEGKSLLLAASIRLHSGDLPALTACVPEPPHWPAPSSGTLATLNALGVDLRPVRNAIADDFPYGNKMECLPPKDDAGTRRIYIDSDILMMRDFEGDALPDADIAAVPASATHADDAAWKEFHALFGLPTTSRRLISLLSKEHTVPYFNGGFVAVRGLPAFGECWGETCRRLRAMPGLAPNIRDRFLDQFGLTLAAARLGREIHAIPLTWNFPSWGLALGDGPTPIFFHYQSPQRLLREMRTVLAVDAVCRAFPEVRAALRPVPGFAELLQGIDAALAGRRALHRAAGNSIP